MPWPIEHVGGPLHFLVLNCRWAPTFLVYFFSFSDQVSQQVGGGKSADESWNRNRFPANCIVCKARPRSLKASNLKAKFEDRTVVATFETHAIMFETKIST
jgi:hypothetical protein